MELTRGATQLLASPDSLAFSNIGRGQVAVPGPNTVVVVDHNVDCTANLTGKGNHPVIHRSHSRVGVYPELQTPIARAVGVRRWSKEVDDRSFNRYQPLDVNRRCIGQRLSDGQPYSRRRNHRSRRS